MYSVFVLFFRGKYSSGTLRFLPDGGCHDQADAKWIVIRGPLRGHNDTPFGWPTPGWPIGQPGVGQPKGVSL